MPDVSSLASEALESLIGQVADEFLARVQRGERPDVEEYVARHPQAADLIRNVLRSLRLIEDSGSDAGGEQPLAGTLGDYRIIREVGRGGMGIVYEAEQISLNRRVALKVLPFAATMDARQLQRFHNEARAAASLHHEHIVPVHGVGNERGVHYFAMQFVDGQTLAQIISRYNTAGEPTTPHPAAAENTTPRPTATQSPRDAAFFRRAAEWGVQAAEALEHAHSLGVVHRDVKPGNLMIDAAGKLWVTDFGLAKFGAEGNLTMTGDVLGTLRYMSPEQALARHGLVDHRTDVYALGVTLYELLSGRPAVEGKDRVEIIRRIADEEPRPLRSENRSIPWELETVVLAALSKEPGSRYASARELAADLKRWLEGQPVLASRPSIVERAAKWARRHRAMVTAGVIALILAVAGLSASVVLLAEERSRTKTEAKAKDDALIAKDEALTAKDQALQREKAERATAEANLREALQMARGQLDWASHLARSGNGAASREVALRLASVLRAGLQRFPQDFDSRVELFSLPNEIAGLLASLHEYAEAATFAEKALASSDRTRALPDNAGEQQQFYLLRDRIELTFRWADLLAAAGRDKEAINAYEACGQLRQELRELMRKGKRIRWSQTWDPVVVLVAWQMAVENGIGTIHLEAGRFAEAEASFRRALASLQAEAKEAEGTPECDHEKLSSLIGLGETYWESGRRPQARATFKDALELLEMWVKLPISTLWPDYLARFLATCPDSGVRDGNAAAKVLAPPPPRRRPVRASDLTRGVVCYASGDVAGAIKFLEACVKKFDGGTAEHYFYLSMAHAKKGDAKAANEWFAKGVEWSDKRRPRALQVRRLRAEASALLAQPQPPKK